MESPPWMCSGVLQSFGIVHRNSALNSERLPLGLGWQRPLCFVFSLIPTVPNLEQTKSFRGQTRLHNVYLAYIFPPPQSTLSPLQHFSHLRGASKLSKTSKKGTHNFPLVPCGVYCNLIDLGFQKSSFPGTLSSEAIQHVIWHVAHFVHFRLTGREGEGGLKYEVPWITISHLQWMHSPPVSPVLTPGPGPFFLLKVWWVISLVTHISSLKPKCTFEIY